MKKILPLLGVVLLVTATAVPAIAQFSVSPSSAAFAAEVGSSDEVTFQVTNGPAIGPAMIQSVTIQGADAALFSWDWVEAPTGGLVNPYDIYRLNVTFNPTAAGNFTATLRFTYIQYSPVPIPLDVTLSATATAPAPPPTYTPAELMYQLLAYYNNAIYLKEIYGVGNGRSADNKAKALSNQLEAAAKKVYGGDYNDAVDKLFSILKKVDEAKSPKDFVAGPGLGQLQYRITELIVALGG